MDKTGRNGLRVGDLISENFNEKYRVVHLDGEAYFETDEEKLIKWFDPDKLDKIIYNLLSNAFKFTPNEGWVRIRLTSVYPDQSEAMDQLENKAKQYLGIRVTDNGIGIPEDKIDRIFERYYHMEKFNGKHYEGSGVGLAPGSARSAAGPARI